MPKQGHRPRRVTGAASPSSPEAVPGAPGFVTEAPADPGIVTLADWAAEIQVRRERFFAELHTEVGWTLERLIVLRNDIDPDAVPPLTTKVCRRRGCGHVFTSVVPWQKWCSKECQRRVFNFRRERRREQARGEPPSKCAHCGELLGLDRSPWGGRDQKYCNDACKMKAYRRRLKR